MNTTDRIMARIHACRNAEDRSAAFLTYWAVRKEIMALVRDAKRLDWMIFHSAKVRHSSDGEFCTVIWYDDEGQAHETKPFGSAREAIDAAMQEKQS